MISRNVAKCNLVKVKLETMLASGLNCIGSHSAGEALVSRRASLLHRDQITEFHIKELHKAGSPIPHSDRGYV